LLLYNFPSNAGGQDMSSEVITAIMKQAPNLCGVKLTYVINQQRKLVSIQVMQADL
jgi:hypothetical protein